MTKARPARWETRTTQMLTIISMSMMIATSRSDRIFRLRAE